MHFTINIAINAYCHFADILHSNKLIDNNPLFWTNYLLIILQKSFGKVGVVMDITSLSMGLSQTNLLTDVGTAILAKSIDQSKQVSDAITNLIDSSAMERSVNPDVGGNIDLYV